LPASRRPFCLIVKRNLTGARGDAVAPRKSDSSGNLPLADGQLAVGAGAAVSDGQLQSVVVGGRPCYTPH